MAAHGFLCLPTLQPLASATSLQISGALATGRQITAPPEQYLRRLPVGQHRSVEIAATVKGSRALIKVYTSLKVSAENANTCYGPGIEPTITMVSLKWLGCKQFGALDLRHIG